MGLKARSTGAGYWRSLLERRFGGRRVILAYGHMASVGGDVDKVRSLGASGVFVIAEGVGTGTATADVPHRVVGPGHADNILDGMRAFEAAVADLDDDVVAALDDFDPDRSALVIRPLWGSLLEVAGRRVYNARQPAWVALEDKVVIDAFWDRAGVARAPSEIVSLGVSSDGGPDSVARDALWTAHRRLDRGDGTVWAGDARDGWHGAGHLTCWVRDDDSAGAALERLTSACDRVRVMPFLEGIPCSVHGMVTDRGVAALRPVEMITLREPEVAAFRYFGTSTLWDPPPADRQAMRDTARRAGAVLRDLVGYRGTFSIDGVMTAEGFLPTELNPRFSAGMFRFMPGSPELPLYFVDAAMCAGEPWDFKLDALERLVVTGADATRVAVANAWDSSRRDETTVTPLCRDSAGRLITAGDTDATVGSITSGPSFVGSFHRVAFDPASLAVGSSVGPYVLEALALADRTLGTSFGPLASARDLRR